MSTTTCRRDVPAGRLYNTPLPQVATLGEPAARYDMTPRDLPRESVLSELWETQRFPKGTLTLRDGSTVRVIYRGLPGLGPGPDFRNAVVKLPGGLAQGDVELHVRAGDFYRHGHHLDPAYDNVALHVVFLDDGFGAHAAGTVLSSGRAVPIATVPLPGAGRTPPPYGEPCRGAVSRMGTRAVAETLDRLGAMRFRRLAFLTARMSAENPPENLLWRGILEALSYGGTVRLNDAIPWRTLREELLRQPRPTRVAHATHLLLTAHSFTANEKRHGRPGNRPERRLEGAAVLAARFAEEGLGASLLGVLDEDHAVSRLLDALTVPKLIGRPRAIEIAGNAVLPLAAALTGEPASSRYEALFGALPMPARYGAVRHLHSAVGGAVKPSARRQQGMLYLLKQYCTQGGCGRCPLS